MNNIQSIFAVDAHTTGTPIRVITGGIPTLRGCSVGDKMEYMRENYDWLRTFVMQQPRGFLSLVGAVLTAPCSEDADYGLFYIDALTYQPMCGAGTLAVAKVLVETGMVKRVEPETVIKLETPTGIVTVYVSIKDGVVGEISLENVPAFLYRKDLILEVPTIGEMKVDIGFGGNFFTLVDLDSIGEKLSKDNLAHLRELSKDILAAANSAIKVQHPVKPAINYMDQLLYCNNVPNENGEYYAQCIFGDAQADISPCGTGTSTRLAQRYMRSLIEENTPFYQKSIYGGVFKAAAIREEYVGEFRGIIPRVSCSDIHITAFSHLVAEENDKFKHGFVSW